MRQVDVAILGGGVAGLSAAMFMQGWKNPDTGEVFHCDVYEKLDRFGGNVDSAYGGHMFAPPFGDLGVNDFNHSTYKLLVVILELLKAQGYDVPYAPLTDTTLFFTPRGQMPVMAYTYDELKNPTDPVLKLIAKDWQTFRGHITDALQNPRTRSMTVDDYCAEMGFSQEFIDYNLKPRINGMYYTNGGDPGDMSIYGVMVYYALQENIADFDETGTRMYFINGASSWIEVLRRWAEDHGTGLFPGTEARVWQDNGSWIVNGRPYDKVISALPASALADTFQQYLSRTVVGIADRVVYLDATTWWHRDPTVLPEDPDLWKTYNITIEPSGQTSDRPYTISYVSDMHQGGNGAAPPFVTVNPPHKLKDVLTMRDPADPSRTIEAKVTLPHNTLYPQNIADQATLRTVQGEQSLWFTGGWTVGAGLHEEVLSQSLLVSLQAMGIFSDAHHPVHDPDDPQYVPRHIRAHAAGETVDAGLLPPGHPLLG
jgi:predicted NAD/FAD-binding protein